MQAGSRWGGWRTLALTETVALTSRYVSFQKATVFENATFRGGNKTFHAKRWRNIPLFT